MQLKGGVKQKESILGEYPFSSYFPKWIKKSQKYSCAS